LTQISFAGEIEKTKQNIKNENNNNNKTFFAE